jgi:hypothetical protein
VSKRSQKQQLTPLQADDQYWTRFISHRFGSLETLEKATGETLPEEAETVADPNFIKFLQVIRQYGGPTVDEFRKLSVADKRYYLSAYKVWLQKLKQLNINPRNL